MRNGFRTQVSLPRCGANLESNFSGRIRLRHPGVASKADADCRMTEKNGKRRAGMGLPQLAGEWCNVEAHPEMKSYSRDGLFVSVSPAGPQHSKWRLQQDFQVEPRRPHTRVQQVQADHVVEAGTAATADLP